MLLVVFLVYRKLDSIIKRLGKGDSPLLDTPPVGGTIADLSLSGKTDDPEAGAAKTKKKLVKQFSKGRLTKEKIAAIKAKKQTKKKSSHHHHLHQRKSQRQ